MEKKLVTPIDNGYCGSLTWNYDPATSTLTISGTGEMEDFSNETKTPWNSFRNAITTVIISDGVTSIGDKAFCLCNALTSVNIPSGVSSISSGAFECCKSLTSINIPDGVTSIGDYAFACCKALTSLYIPESVNSIGEFAFYQCHALTSINIPSSITCIKDSTFLECISLPSINIPDGVTSIEQHAFDSCQVLSSINIPSNIEFVGGCAFSDTPFYYNLPDGFIYFAKTFYGYKGDDFEITSINIKEGTKHIGCWSLDFDTSSLYYSEKSAITSITIPSSVEEISPYAFGTKSSRDLDVYCLPTVPPTIDEDFDFCDLGNSTLHVPASAINDYINDEYWNIFKNIVPIQGI